MKITSGKEYDTIWAHNCYCDECFQRLDLEVHNPGEIQKEYYIAYCECGYYQFTPNRYKVELNKLGG